MNINHSATSKTLVPKHGVSLREFVEAQARALGAAPITSVDDLRCDCWDSDEELDAFLADLAASRRP